MADKPPLCLYHNDADGACSAWVVRKMHPDSDCVAVRYGELAPIDLAAGRLVYVVDFSYPTEQLMSLADVASRMVVIDHHKTGRQRLDGLAASRNAAHRDRAALAASFDVPEDGCRIVFDQDRSGCGLTWDTLIGGNRPWWVDYVEDRDLWRFNLPHSKAVNAYISSRPFGPEMFDELRPMAQTKRMPYNRAPRDVIAMGNAILDYQRQQVEMICRQAYRGKLPGGMYTVPIVNTNALISEVTHELAKNEPFAASWYLRADGRVRWSLRSTEDGIDVSKLALTLGGGGHKHAAGFHTDKLEAING